MPNIGGMSDAEGLGAMGESSQGAGCRCRWFWLRKYRRWC